VQLVSVSAVQELQLQLADLQEKHNALATQCAQAEVRPCCSILATQIQAGA
jgi:hypothetical protein